MSLHSAGTTLKAQELRMFWRLSQMGNELTRANPRDPEIDFIREEMDLMAEMTDWPSIREACQRWLRLNDQARRPFKRVRVTLAGIG